MRCETLKEEAGKEDKSWMCMFACVKDLPGDCRSF
jgi:hypothetical protein